MSDIREGSRPKQRSLGKQLKFLDHCSMASARLIRRNRSRVPDWLLMTSLTKRLIKGR